MERNKEAIDILLNEREYVLALMDNALIDLCQEVTEKNVENFSDVMYLLEDRMQNYVCRYVGVRVFGDVYPMETFDSMLHHETLQALLDDGTPYERWQQRKGLELALAHKTSVNQTGKLKI